MGPQWRAALSQLEGRVNRLEVVNTEKLDTVSLIIVLLKVFKKSNLNFRSIMVMTYVSAKDRLTQFLPIAVQMFYSLNMSW